MTSHALNNAVLPARRLTQAIGAWARALLRPQDQVTTPVEGSRSAPVAHLAEGPATLDAMGVPGPIARELEYYFELMGKTRGDQVVGYTFITPDGREHAIRTTRTAGAADLDRAA